MSAFSNLGPGQLVVPVHSDVEGPSAPRGKCADVGARGSGPPREARERSAGRRRVPGACPVRRRRRISRGCRVLRRGVRRGRRILPGSVPPVVASSALVAPSSARSTRLGAPSAGAADPLPLRSPRGSSARARTLFRARTAFYPFAAPLARSRPLAARLYQTRMAWAAL